MNLPLRIAAVAAWMALIFFFSSQTGGESAGLSTRVVDLLAPAFPALDPAALGTLVRKAAHVSEFAVLGALLTWAWPREARWSLLAPLLIGIGYAASDEVHQLFVPGRSGQVSDVLIDAVGVLIGIALVAGVRRRRDRDEG